MNIGKSIVQLRKDKKLNQSELAELSNITVTTLSLIENGHSQPTKKNLEAICEALGVTPQILYLLSVDISDVPESKRRQFEEL